MDHFDHLRRSRSVLVVAFLAAVAGAAPAPSLGAPGGPPALAVWDQPAEAYQDHPFDFTVALVDSSQYPMSAITSGFAVSVTLELRSPADVSATLTCASGLTLTTESPGASVGRATFSGCQIDQVGTFAIWVKATSDGSIAEPTQSAPITVRLPIEAPQST